MESFLEDICLAADVLVNAASLSLICFRRLRSKRHSDLALTANQSSVQHSAV